MIHAGDHEEAKVVGNTAARRLLDGGVVLERALWRDNRIRAAVSPSLSRLCRGNLQPILLVQSRPTSPVMVVQVFETREEAKTWVAAR